jgi:hypothetical protein
MPIVVPQIVVAGVSINAATGAVTVPVAGAAPIADGAGGVAWGAPAGSPYTRKVYRIVSSAAAALYTDANITFAWDAVAGQVMFTRTAAKPSLVVGQYLVAAGGVRCVVAASAPSAAPAYLSSLTSTANARFNPPVPVSATIWNEFLLTENSATPLTGAGLAAPSYKVTVLGAALGTAAPNDFANVIVEVMAP